MSEQTPESTSSDAEAAEAREVFGIPDDAEQGAPEGEEAQPSTVEEESTIDPAIDPADDGEPHADPTPDVKAVEDFDQAPTTPSGAPQGDAADDEPESLREAAQALVDGFEEANLDQRNVLLARLRSALD